MKSNPRFGARAWVKLWVNEWLDGTTRFEMTDAQRAFWTDLLALAGRSRFPGVICAGRNENGSFVGYPLNKFQSLMSEPINVEETFALFVRTGKIAMEITADSPHRLFKIELLNWSKYQSEYQRQKRYRTRGLQAELQKGDSRSDSQGNKTEVDREVEEKQRQRHAAWKAIGISPCGPIVFQTLWQNLFEERSTESLERRMSRCLNEWDGIRGNYGRPAEFCQVLTGFRGAQTSEDEIPTIKVPA